MKTQLKAGSNIPVLIGSLVGLIPGVIQFIVVLKSNNLDGLFSSSFFVLNVVATLIFVFIGGFLGYLVKTKSYRALVIYSLLFFVTIGLNLSGPVSEYISPHSTFKEKVTIGLLGFF